MAVTWSFDVVADTAKARGQLTGFSPGKPVERRAVVTWFDETLFRDLEVCRIDRLHPDENPLASRFGDQVDPRNLGGVAPSPEQRRTETTLGLVVDEHRGVGATGSAIRR